MSSGMHSLDRPPAQRSRIAWSFVLRWGALAVLMTVGLAVGLAGVLAFLSWFVRTSTETLDRLQPAVEEFHRRYNAEEYATIYDTSAPRLQRGLRKDEALRRLSNAHSRLGNVVTISLGCFTIESQRNIRRIEYRVTFEKAEAWETFDWQLEDDTPQLLAYAVETGSAHGQTEWEEVLAPRRVRPNATTCADEDNPAHWWEQTTSLR